MKVLVKLLLLPFLLVVCPAFGGGNDMATIYKIKGVDGVWRLYKVKEEVIDEESVSDFSSAYEVYRKNMGVYIDYFYDNVGQKNVEVLKVFMKKSPIPGKEFWFVGISYRSIKGYEIHYDEVVFTLSGRHVRSVTVQ